MPNQFFKGAAGQTLDNPNEARNLLALIAAIQMQQGSTNNSMLGDREKLLQVIQELRRRQLQEALGRIMVPESATQVNPNIPNPRL
jgi:hypothetical protein